MSLLRQLLHGFRNLLRRRHAEEEIVDEVENFFAETIADFEARGLWYRQLERDENDGHNQPVGSRGRPERLPVCPGSAFLDFESGRQSAHFTLPSTDGGDVHLADYLGKSTVVLAFFPAAFTGG